MLAEKLKAAAVEKKLKQSDSKVPPQSNANDGSMTTCHHSRATANSMAAVAAANLRGGTQSWGSYTFQEKQDILSLSNEKLKRHLKARGELTEGSKRELIARLISSLEEEKQREFATHLDSQFWYC